METGRDANGIKSLNRHILEQIMAANPAAVLVVDARDPQLPVVYANPAYERLMSCGVEEILGHPWAVFDRAPPAGDEGLARLKAAIGRGDAGRATLPSSTIDVSVTPLHDASGELRYFLCVHEPFGAIEVGHETEVATPAAGDATGEISQREVGGTRQKIATMDRIDPATGLLRFAHFQETLRRDLAMARRDRRFVTLLVFEIVEFGVYRQTFGGKAADSCQRMIGAQIMRTLRRAGDLCARYDDSTLVAAVFGQHVAEIQPLIDQVAENVRQLKLHNPRAKSSRHIATRATAINCPPGAHDDPEPLIARALADSRSGDAPLRAVLG
jgi:diguanylate cyclase (GGDEF)-like protein